MIKVRNYNLFKNNSRKNNYRKKKKTMKLCGNKKYKKNIRYLRKASKKSKKI